MSYTNQEVYTKVKAHLLKQGRKAQARNENGDFRCLYRAPDGAQCAVGCLIPDDLYNPVFESRSAERVAGVLPELFQSVDSDLLTDLQRVHDENNPETWPDHLDSVAQKFNLEDI